MANSTGTFGYSSGSPVVTSDGTNLASAVVWEVYSDGTDGGHGTLEAFPAIPPASCKAAAPCRISPVWSAPIGTAAEFTIPAINAGRVYVGTKDGHVIGFGTPVPAVTASRAKVR